MMLSGPNAQHVSIGAFLLGRLREIGVRHIFGVAGDFNLVLLEQLEHYPDLTWIGNCNELNAAYAADGYARVNGIAACVTTYGVGELSAINGVAGAYSERVPIVFITGAPPLSEIDRRGLLHHTGADGNYDNMMICMRQFTVAQSRITSGNASYEIDRCLKACVQEKRPVYLQLPSDIPLLQIPLPSQRLATESSSDAELLNAAVSHIRRRFAVAKSPAALIDADIDRFGLSAPLQRLLDETNIPFAVMITAKGVLNENQPQFLGVYAGAMSPPSVREIVESSDCLLTFGVRFVDSTTASFSQRIRPSSHIDVRDWSVRVKGETFQGIAMRDAIERMTLELPRSRTWTGGPPKADRFNGKTEPLGEPLTQNYLWARIERFLQPNDIVLTENGTSLSGISTVSLPEGCKVISQPIWGSIGYTLPATLGSLIGASERRHLLFIGDGSFQLTAQELSTILRHELKPIVFLLNNSGYTIERLILGSESSYNDIQPWRYADLCAVFDQEGHFTSVRVTTSSELEKALKTAETGTGLTFIEVVLDTMDAPPSLRALGPIYAKQDYGQKWLAHSDS